MTARAQEPRVTIVVPTFRRPDALRLTLAALLEVDYPTERYEIVVIDDGSHDETGRVVRELAREQVGPEVRYVEQDNSGAATARNRGAAAARGDVLIFVDDDIIVAPDHIHRHVVALAEDRRAVVNGHWEFAPEVLATLERTPFGRFRLMVEAWVKASIAKEHVGDGRVRPSAVTACNLGIRREFFLELGGFDESFPVAGYEDQEFSYRAAGAGARLLYDYSIQLLHNDNRMTLQQFCRRQQQGAMTAVVLAAKHPDAFGQTDLIIENRPASRGDGAKLVTKKAAKRLLASSAGLNLLDSIVKVLERRAPNGQLLRRTYWSICGLHLFLGVRDGWARLRLEPIVIDHDRAISQVPVLEGSQIAPRARPRSSCPAVSVVIPAFNASGTIRSTLQSVLDQTFDDIEVIVIDDGSTDATASLAAGLGSPVRTIRISNGGVSRARNRGIAESTGRYLAFLDADDLWMPTKLEEQIRVLDQDSDAGACYVGVLRVDANHRLIERLPAREFDDLCASLLLYSSVIPSSPSSLVVRREVDARIGGFDHRYSQCADWDYLLRLSRATKLRPVPTFLAVHVSGDWNMSRDIALLERDTFAVLARFYSEEKDPSYLALERRCRGNHWMILSGSYLHAGDVLSSLRCLCAGLRQYPQNVARPLGLPLRWVHRRVLEDRVPA